MKVYISLAVIFATIYTSQASVLIGGPKIVEGIAFDHSNQRVYQILLLLFLVFWLLGYPNQCYVEPAKEGYAVGEHNPIGKCMKIYCHKDFSYVVHTYVKLINCIFLYHALFAIKF